MAVTTRVVTGNPRPEDISTSHVERHNLTMRMSMRRFTRLTNGFSKKLENHVHMLAIYFVWYNWCRPTSLCKAKLLRWRPASRLASTTYGGSLVSFIKWVQTDTLPSRLDHLHSPPTFQKSSTQPHTASNYRITRPLQYCYLHRPYTCPKLRGLFVHCYILLDGTAAILLASPSRSSTRTELDTGC